MGYIRACVRARFADVSLCVMLRLKRRLLPTLFNFYKLFFKHTRFRVFINKKDYSVRAGVLLLSMSSFFSLSLVTSSDKTLRLRVRSRFFSLLVFTFLISLSLYCYTDFFGFVAVL